MSRIPVGIIVLLLSVGGMVRAETPQEQAKKFLKEGKALYNADKFDEARASFARAQALVPDNARLFFYVGLCDALSGNCGGAVKNLEEFLRRAPADDKFIGEANTRRDNCLIAMGRKPGTPVQPLAAAAPAKAAQPPAAPAPATTAPISPAPITPAPSPMAKSTAPPAAAAPPAVNPLGALATARASASGALRRKVPPWPEAPTAPAKEKKSHLLDEDEDDLPTGPRPTLTEFVPPPAPAPSTPLQDDKHSRRWKIGVGIAAGAVVIVAGAVVAGALLATRDPLGGVDIIYSNTNPALAGALRMFIIGGQF